MNLPYLTAYHTLENSQGTIDPLGLDPVADRLGTRLLPGFRERMKHPRYLTALTLGALLCSVFDDGEIAADEITSPSQIYEWFIASALVKYFSSHDKDQLTGMPGREKTTTAMSRNIPLTAANYLKTPVVFGFQGVYRTLAKQMGLVDSDSIREFGMQLVEVWEREQNLSGFILNQGSGPGGKLRANLVKGIRESLVKKAVAKSWQWSEFATIAQALTPKLPGKQESELIYTELTHGQSGVRKDIVEFICLNHDSIDSELDLHKQLIQHSIGDVNLLRAIQAYEYYARLLHNAFYQSMSQLQAQNGKARLADFTDLPAVKSAAQKSEAALATLVDCFGAFPEESNRLTDSFKVLGENTNIKDWTKLLFEHHFAVQSKKLPGGKAAWLIEDKAGMYLLNSLQDFDAELDDGYVRQYRFSAVKSFMKDLGKLN